MVHTSSVANFFPLGGKTLKCTDRKKCITYMRERAPQKYMYFRSHNTSVYIQSIQRHSTVNDSMNDKTLLLRKIYEYASERSERAEHFLHLLILKLHFLSIFCWYFRYFVSETYIFLGLQLHRSAYTYKINAVSFHYL